jgi:tetratricopeptide (TPR) repeat protein
LNYNAVIKEKLGKLLFLEIDKKAFKEMIKIPSYVEFENKDLYLPISPKYITENIQNEIKIKNLPIYHFVEGMIFAIGADENLRFNKDYEIILTYISDTESCIKSVIAKSIKEDNLIEAYILLKGFYRYSKDKEIMEKLLLVGETLKEKDNAFKEMLLKDIDYSLNHLLNINEAYLYKALILKDENDYKGAKIAINEYINNGGKMNDDIEILVADINNVSNYELAIEHLEDDPVKSIKLLVDLLDKFPENPLVYYYLAVAYRKLENYDKAVYYLNESLEIETGIYEVIIELGINYACLNDFETAIKYFKKAFEATKEVEVCTNIVMCYLNLNNIKEAKIHLELAKNINPEDEIVKELEKILENSK